MVGSRQRYAWFAGALLVPRTRAGLALRNLGIRLAARPSYRGAPTGNAGATVVGGLGALSGLIAGAIFIYFMQISWAQNADLIVPDWLPWIGDLDTSRPGVYSYTVHVQLHELVERNDELVWESVDLTCESNLKLISDPKRNGFTGAGLSVLPLPPVPAAG